MTDTEAVTSGQDVHDEPAHDELEDADNGSGPAEGDGEGDQEERLVAEGEIAGVPQGRYLVDGQGKIQYLVDPAINGRVKERDDGGKVANKFDAPKTQLMALIVGGILNQKLPWALVLMGVLIAIAVELLGVPSLPFAVGVYLPIQTSVPIFIGGIVRWMVDRMSRRAGAESDMSPGTLLSTGYIAGGTIGGVVVAFMSFSQSLIDKLDLSKHVPDSNWPAIIMFVLIIMMLVYVGLQRLSTPEVPARQVIER